jgi:hypothetical protein
MPSYYLRVIRLIAVFGIFISALAALAACGNSSDKATEEINESGVEVSSQPDDEQIIEEATSEAEEGEESESGDTEEQVDPESLEESEEGEESESGDTEEQVDPESLEESEEGEEETPTEQPAQRIQFTTGDIGEVIEGRILQSDPSPVYVLGASAQQLMQMTLTSLEGDVSFDVGAPNGEKLVTGITQTKVLLPVDGDYLIYINSLSGDASYSLDVLITSVVEYVPVEFQDGTSSATISGGMLRGETGPVYGLVAAAGQRMEVTITSLEENASFDVLTPSGEYLISEIMGQEFEFSAILPENGEYLITTNALRGNVSFDLNISVRD